MKRGHKILVIFLILIALIFLALAREIRRPVPVAPPVVQEQQTTIPSVEIGDTLVTVDIADTPALRQQGLSGREDLEGGTGLLFVFEEEGRYGFWMKDMLFAIDIIWFNRDGQVIHITYGATPKSFPMIFEPPTPAYYVLEVPAGFVEKENIAVGDEAKFTL